MGRPLAHIVTNLVGYDRLVTDTQAVLDTLLPQDAEVQTTEGRGYAMRIQSYYGLEVMHPEDMRRREQLMDTGSLP